MPAAWAFVIALGSLTSDSVNAAPVEHLIVLSPDQTIVAEADGGPASVVIDPAIDALLHRPDARLTLTHNHPNSAGFSADDLLQLSKPGVVAILAFGADGSRYEASRGPRYDIEAFERRQYQVAENAVVQALRGERARLNGRNLDAHVAHLTSLALHRAGVIAYEAVLKGMRGMECFDLRMPFSRVATTAASRLKRGR